jgi:Flp pilus assembly protein TadD
MRGILTSAAALYLFVSGHALADDWREASSDHFVIYAEEDEKEIRKYSDRLERYHSAMSSVLKSNKVKPSPSGRVTIYVVRNERIVRKLYGSGDNARYIGGFYSPRAGGSLAIIPPIDITGAEASKSELVLMHEYAHHFMAVNTTYLVPRWYGEGYAEFFATAKFEKDGAVGLGLPANHRANELFEARDVSIEQLLDSKLYRANKSQGYDNFYGRAWALFHYLFTDAERRKQLVDYLNRLNKGEAELAAATAAFGDLKALDKSLDKYIKQRQWNYLRIRPDWMTVGPITVRRLSEGEAASMPIRIRSKRGVDEKTAAEVVVDAREVAAKYPDEPAVQAALAEAEFDAGNDEAAIVAADKALAVAPTNMTALIQKGYALTRMADEAGTEVAWKAARKHFISVNKIENDHPIPLVYYYLSFLKQGKEPRKDALDGLEWALELAPYDNGVRMMVARRQMEEKRFADAIRTISPLAYNPHAGEDNPAIALLDTARKEMAAVAGNATGKQGAAETGNAAAPR